MYENNGNRPTGSRPGGSGSNRPYGSTGARPTGSRSVGSGTGSSRPYGSTGARPTGSRPVGSGTGSSRPYGSTGARPTGSRPVGSGTGSSRPYGSSRTTGSTGSRPYGSSTGRTAATSGNRPSGSQNPRPTGNGPVGGGNRPNGPKNGNKKPMTIEERRRREYLKLKKERQRKKKLVIWTCLGIIAALLIIGMVWSIATAGKNSGGDDKKGTSGKKPTTTVGASNNNTTPQPTNTPLPTPTPEPKKATLIAVGDDLVHTGVYKAGLQSDGTHDYSCLFENVAGYISDADIKVINQETIFGGDEKGLSSYPNFNSPEAIGDAMVDAGFNVVLHASNHSLDMGLDGLLNSVDYWKTSHPETLVLGIYETAEEQAEIPIMEVNGIKFAMLNYTYSHNWATWSQNAEGHLNMLCAYNEGDRYIDFDTINPQVLEDIEAAEELADFTIVFPHWGTEYVTSATAQEVKFAEQMTEAGADLIIGTHPHVIQPVEWVESDNGNKSLCYYSLGNFTSTQDEWERLLGAMAKVTIIQDENGTYIDEESIKAIPVVTHYVYPGWNGATVVESTYLLNDYTEAMAASHGILNRCGITVTRDKLLTLSQDVLGQYYSLEY